MDNMSPRHNQLLVCLSYLPHKLLSVHGNENVTEFLLHELCQPHCFNLKKAAYFVDNPDFDCLKGVAGFNREEEYSKENDCWQTPEQFTQHMRSCHFNQRVRDIQRPSSRRKNDQETTAHDLAQHLSLQNPYSMLSWPLKHDNHGMLIFEATQPGEGIDEHMKNGLHLLAFCPVF